MRSSPHLAPAALVDDTKRREVGPRYQQLAARPAAVLAAAVLAVVSLFAWAARLCRLLLLLLRCICWPRPWPFLLLLLLCGCILRRACRRTGGSSSPQLLPPSLSMLLVLLLSDGSRCSRGRCLLLCGRRATADGQARQAGGDTRQLLLRRLRVVARLRCKQAAGGGGR